MVVFSVMRLPLALLIGACCFSALLASQAPYGGGVPTPLPGAWQAEHYDEGGPGVAYQDLTPTNTAGGTLREGDAVDIAADAAASGGFVVTNAAVGEWLEYTVDAAFSAERPFANFAITYAANYPKRIRLTRDGVAVTEVGLPAAASWQTLTLEKVPVVSGAGQVLRVEVLESGENALFANRTGVSATEQWDVEDLGDGAVALRSVATGRYFRVTSKDHPIYAGGLSVVDNRERLQLGDLGSGQWSIFSLFSNTFLSAGSATSSVGIKATSVGSNRERFTLQDLGVTPGATAGTFPLGHRVAIHSVQLSRFLSIGNDDGLRLDRFALTQWVNRPPVVNVGFGRTLSWPANSVTLSATARELDASGSLVARGWSQVSGPAAATLGTQTTTTDALGVQTTTVAISALQRGVYVFEFFAEDDMGDRSTARIEVAVIDAAQHTLVAPTDSRIQYHGRVHNIGGSAPIFGWSSTGFVVRFSGSSISLRLGAGSWPSTKQALLAIIDGDETNPRILDMSRNGPIAHIASGLAPGEHTLRLFTMNGAWVAPTTFNGILLGAGTTLLEPPARPTRRIEFYGDSITEGSYLDGEPFTNGYKAFAAQTALRLGAEMSLIAKSGLGLVKTGYSGGHTLEMLFPRSLPHDSASTWNFDQWIPQVVVINILQNDSWLQGGSPDQEFIDAYVRFLRLLRAQRPYARVICALGSMDATRPGSKWPGIVQAAVDRVAAEDGDARLHTYFFPYLGAGTGHPQPAQAAEMADALAAFIAGIDDGAVWTSAAAPSAGFRTWAATQFPVRHAAEAMPLADADGDGVVNLLEYALGGDPWSGGSAPAPAIEPAPPGGLVFRFRRAAAEANYTVVTSTDLASWSPAPWPVVDAGGGFASVTVPADEAARRFLRLVVTVPTE